MNGSTIAFLVAYVAGAICIAAGTYSGYGPLSFWGSVLAVVAYGACAPFAKRWNVPRELFGDSVYFLGFLFTLTGLAASLLVIPRIVGGGGSVDAIVPQFALALGTTIVGLIGRMIISGFSSSEDLAVQEAEAALAESSIRLGKQMDLFASHMSHHVTTTGKVLETVLANAAKALDAHLEALKPLPQKVENMLGSVAISAGQAAEHAISTVAAAGLRVVSDFHTNVAQISADTAVAASGAVAPLAKATATAAAAVDGLTRAVGLPSQDIAQRLAEMAAAGQKYADSLVRLSKTTVTAADDLPEAHRRLVSGLSDSSKAIDESTSAFQAAALRMEAVRTALDEYTGREGAATKDLTELLENARVLAGEAAAATGVLRDQVGLLQQAVADGKSYEAQMAALRQRTAEQLGLTGDAVTGVVKDLRAAVAALRADGS